MWICEFFRWNSLHHQSISSRASQGQPTSRTALSLKARREKWGWNGEISKCLWRPQNPRLSPTKSRVIRFIRLETGPVPAKTGQWSAWRSKACFMRCSKWSFLHILETGLFSESVKQWELQWEQPWRHTVSRIFPGRGEYFWPTLKPACTTYIIRNLLTYSCYDGFFKAVNSWCVGWFQSTQQSHPTSQVGALLSKRWNYQLNNIFRNYL